MQPIKDIHIRILFIPQINAKRVRQLIQTVQRVEINFGSFSSEKALVSGKRHVQRFGHLCLGESQFHTFAFQIVSKMFDHVISGHILFLRLMESL